MNGLAGHKTLIEDEKIFHREISSNRIAGHPYAKRKK